MEPRYTVIFSQKIPASKSNPGSPTGPLWREQLMGHFYISSDIYLSITKVNVKQYHYRP
jgi:hypothetical protein